ncbi:uncharacterized protein LY79DRAFT_541958 [Colletotrichum navitas]|uniref:Uncharacterized protein n=1 Tax=Colletotrichum navitas TaxID=681940 RepID=A0AAD8V8L1_9PEZI|nr:uncharacterized protein LY79DRAFT_541958 [Colletotrichum navitas]KAK1597034.1 hypothetical protein LY79DRAFT_541958 [Colletotrichum navitas]
MAPQQNTFAVIPAAPGRVGGAPSKPPMTSKQAQKLYKQANKEPRRSKSEQRRWEKERQEEIRKELEKERAAAKARAARERKKAKEEEARKSRQRAGQPLFDCRPSQDTIARFVRGNGTSRKRDSSGEPVPKDEDTPASSLENKPKTSLAPSAARAASSVSCPPPTTPERPKPPAISMAPPPRPSQKSRAVNKPPQSLPNPPNQPPSWDIPPPPMHRSKDDPAVPPSSLLKVADSSNHVPDKTLAVPVSMGPPLRLPLKSKSKPFMMPRVTLPVQQLPGHKVFKHNPPSKSTPIPPLSGPSLQQKLSLPSPAPLGEPPQMPPPQVPSQKPPPKSTVPTPLLKSLSKDPTSQNLSVQTPPLSRPQPQAPPPSTQAIVQDCFDDFFPTASQLAMELEQDSDSDTQPGEALDQQSDDPVAAKVAHGEHVVRSSAMEKAGEQTQAADNGYRKPDKSTCGNPTARHLASLSASAIYPNPSALLRGSTRLQASTKAHEEPQGLEHRSQKQEKQSQVSTSSRALDSHSVNTHSRNAATRTMPPPTKPSRLQDRSAKTKRGVLQEISGNHSPTPNPMATAMKPQLPTHFDDFFPLICTQDLMMSSQEVLDIESTTKNTTQSSGQSPPNQLPFLEMDLAAIDWDDDLDDF